MEVDDSSDAQWQATLSPKRAIKRPKRSKSRSRKGNGSPQDANQDLKE
jgi:hypothetical protein